MKPSTPVASALLASFLSVPLAGGEALACAMPEPRPVVVAAAPATAPVPAKAPRKIELVLALDTSNSMDGLINSAKARLWDIVNELSRAKPTPELRVALYTYGTPSYGAKTGFVRQESAFTKDLDALYQKLSAVRTNGGTEYVARVTKAAVEELDWDDDAKTLKILFVAGNEAATQDPENDVLAVAKKAVSQGIVVNTIFCGNASDSVASAWASVAKAADGKYAVIDQEKGVRIASTPMDGKLAELSQQLNQTYVGYGRGASKRKEAQVRSDEAAASMGAGVAASRATAKSSALYDNSEWDLVDAQKKGKVDMKDVPAEALPAPMQAMSTEERTKYVDEMASKRESIQKEIATLSAEREKYVRAEEAKAAKAGEKGLDSVLKAQIRTQAQEAGFTFE